MQTLVGRDPLRVETLRNQLRRTEFLKRIHIAKQTSATKLEALSLVLVLQPPLVRRLGQESDGLFVAIESTVLLVFDDARELP